MNKNLSYWKLFSGGLRVEFESDGMTDGIAGDCDEDELREEGMSRSSSV
jgi:hypothetical protein